MFQETLPQLGSHGITQPTNKNGGLVAQGVRKKFDQLQHTQGLGLETINTNGVGIKGSQLGHEA